VRTTDGDEEQRPEAAAGPASRPAEGPLGARARDPKAAPSDPEAEAPQLGEDEPLPAARQMPLGIVVARILIVSGLGFAAALGVFFLVGGLWLYGLIGIGVALVFLFLMFAVERGAE